MDEFTTGYLAGQDSGNNGGFGGMFGEGLWAIIILAMLGFGNGGWGGFGGFGGYGGFMNGALTRAELYDGFAMQNIDSAVRGVQQGICDSTYALNNSLMTGFHGVDNAICSLGYQTQSGFNTLGAQLASCCCDTQRAIERGFCDTNYNLATSTANIVQAGHCDTDRVIAKLDAMENARQAEKIEALRLENLSLKFASSQASQNAFISANQEAQTAELIRRLRTPDAVPAYVVPNPNCCYGNPAGIGYGAAFSGGNCGCGC